MAPLMSSAMASLKTSLEEQQQAVEDLMIEAKRYISSDESVIRLLGEPIQVGAPFSQSSSTSSINGKTTTNVELAFPVSGSMGSGIARLTASEAGVQRIDVQANGRTIPVDLTSSGSRFSSKRSSRDDDIIEAEIIEKDTKR